MPLLLRKTNVQAPKERRCSARLMITTAHLRTNTWDYKKQARCIEQCAREAAEA